MAEGARGAGGCIWTEPLEQRMLLSGDVVISEFMASNKTTLADSDGDYSDWIELYNRGDESVNLNGWYLTDNAQDLTQWRFPGQSIAPGQYLVVFASGKNRTIAGSQLHTNFKLDGGGEYLGLIEPDGVTPHQEFTPSYPTQSQDVSYGLASEATPGSALQFFATPTPGAPNAPNAQSPIFSISSRAFSGSLTITLTSPTPGATIRYTTNRAIPTSNSTRYTGPITISKSTVIRARVYASGKSPSPVVSQVYEAVDSTVSNFNSNLPIVVLDTFGSGLSDTTLTTASGFFIDTSSADGRAEMLDSPDFAGRLGMRLRGQSSQGFPKAPYALETWDEGNNDKEYSILGMPQESDWILYDPYSEKSLMQNYLAYEWANRMGEYAVRTRYVEVFVNSDGGQTLNYSSDYVGVYIFMEKIKIDNDRVDIQELEPSDNTAPNVTGGYIWKKDKFDAGESGFTTNSGQTWLNVEPSQGEITPAQQSYLTGYINEFESVLYGPSFADPVNGYAKYIDVDSFIDNWILVEMTKNIDGFRLSTYYYKDRGGKIHMGPVWDYNLSLGNADYYGGASPTGWYSDQLGDGDYPYWRRLFQDPNFKQKLVDRWEELRTNELSTTNLTSDIDDLVTLLSDGNGNFPVGNNPPQTPNNPVVRNFQRWHVLGTYVWPNGHVDSQGRWIEDVNWMKNWLTQRVAWMDNQFSKMPTISQDSGDFTAPFQVTITAPSPNAVIYYTTNGSDPRLAGGAINPAAKRYTGPITISGTTRLRARVFTNATVWSGLADEIYNFGESGLRVTEIMYNPEPPPANSPYLPGDFEYIELQNTGATALNLGGYSLTNGVEFTFTSGTLAPGAYAVLVRNPAAFQSRYGAGIPIAGTYAGALNDGGERITLKGPVGETIQKFTFKDGWYRQTDGEGFSLVINNPQGGLAAWDEQDGWRASAVRDGNPGGPDDGLPDKSININEVLSTAVNPGDNWIELANATPNPIDLSGWYLSDSKLDLRKYQFPLGTILAANGYLVLGQAATFGLAGNAGVLTPFSLTAAGGVVYLSSGDGGGNVGGYRESAEFGGAQTGVSFGRYVKSTGGDDFVAQVSATPGEANSAPVVGPVVINEIMADPPAGKAEFIELRNLTNAAIPLYDVANPSHTWSFTDGILYSFPQGAQIAANGYVIVTSGDPATVRSQYNIPANVPVYGPYMLADGSNILENHGESLSLSRPATVNGTAVSIVVDHVNYDDKAPWATPSPGASWGRKSSSAYGNDPVNWQEEEIGGTPGANNVGTPPPSATIEAVGPGADGSGAGTITISFSKVVQGFDLADLVLSRNGGPNLLTSAQWLASADNVTFTLGNLSPLDFVEGNYTLTLKASGSGITDSVNRPLAVDATAGWTMGRTVVAGTADANAWTINATASELQIWVDAPTSADPTYRAPIASVSSLVLLANGGKDVLSVNGGAIALDASSAGAMAVIVNGPATVTLAPAQDLNALTINDGGKVVLPSDGAHTLRVTGLNITGNGVLDLGNNGLVVSYSDTLQTVTAPGDPVAPLSSTVAGSPNQDPGDSPGAETVDHAVDGFTQKYLNFGSSNGPGINTGFWVTPSFGASTLTGMRIFTANDAVERDPASYTLEGTNDDPASPTAAWNLISSGALALPDDRNLGGYIAIDPESQFNQALTFDNSASFTSYRVLFPTTKGSGNSMQVGEVQLLSAGSSPEAQIQQYVKNWMTNSAGPRIIASHASVPDFSQSGRTLAAFDNHDFHATSFGGVNLKGYNQVLVKYTYLGDANADGKVDPTDYAIVDGLQGLGHSWVTGDLNFDGKTTPDDYAQIDGNQGAGYGGAGGPQLILLPPPPSKAAPAASAVAEPVAPIAAAAPVSTTDAGGDAAPAETVSGPVAAAPASPFSNTPISADRDVLGVQSDSVL